MERGEGGASKRRGGEKRVTGIISKKATLFHSVSPMKLCVSVVMIWPGVSMGL